jgi:hypothetical protein
MYVNEYESNLRTLGLKNAKKAIINESNNNGYISIPLSQQWQQQSLGAV